MLQYFIIHKPYQVITRFSPQPGKKTLGDFFKVPVDVYPVGRLDEDSEGLLILTNDTALNKQLLHPSFMHEREYWVQVDGSITEDALRKLSQGVRINIDGKLYDTRPCKAGWFDEEPQVAARNPPVRFRKSIPTSWAKLILTEGRNRQVRKMTAAAGYPTLRLIRYRIEGLTIAGMQPGDIKEISPADIRRLLFGKK